MKQPRKCLSFNYLLEIAQWRLKISLGEKVYMCICMCVYIYTYTYIYLEANFLIIHRIDNGSEEHF